MADEDESGARPGSGHLSRRALLRRTGQGAVAAGLAAWVVPEIVVASPAGAQPLSAPPGGGSGPSTGPGTGATGSPGGPTAGLGPGSGGGGSGGGGFPEPPGTGATSSAAAGPDAGSGTGHGSLAFTGFDPEALLGLGATLVAGGWTINRWASRHEEHPDAQPPGA